MQNGKNQKLSFGCDIIDEVIGPLNTGVINEIAGEAGKKTSLFYLKIQI